MKKGQSERELLDATGQNPLIEEIKDQNRRLLRENKRLVRVLTDEDRWIEQMESTVAGFPKPKKISIRTPDAKTHAPELEAMLIMTDEHAEEIVKKEELEGLTSTNWAQFLNKSWQVIAKTIELVDIERRGAHIPNLSVIKLGDQATGAIHPEETIGTEYPLPSVVPAVADIFAQQMTILSPHFDEIRFAGVCGNHMRDSKKPAYTRAAERNWDRGIYRIAKAMCRNIGNIEWNIPKSMQYVHNILGWDNLLTHGAEIPRTHRVPYYGIESTVQSQAGLRRHARRIYEKISEGPVPDVEFDLAWMGHFHHRAVLGDCIYICPGLVGPNAHGTVAVHKLSFPRQLLVFFHKTRGVVTEKVIYLLDANENGFQDPFKE